MVLNALLQACINTASAAVPSVNGACQGLPGCGSGAANVFAIAVPRIAVWMIGIAGALGVLFIVLAGFQMVTSLGNDSKIGEQKNALMYALGGLAVAGLAQSIVSFAGTQPVGQGNTSETLPLALISSAVSAILTVFNGIIALVIIVGAMKMLYAQGKAEEFNNGRKVIVWAVIGAIVANLANAFVQALVALLR